jgi:hypothetical protein
MAKLVVEPAIMVPVTQDSLVKGVIDPMALPVPVTHAVVKARRAAPAVVLEAAEATSAPLDSAAC